MNILAKYTGVALLISIPILLAISRRYGTIKVTAKQVGFIVATFASLLFESLDLFAGHTITLFSFVLLLLIWIFTYLVSSWMHQQMYQK